MKGPGLVERAENRLSAMSIKNKLFFLIAAVLVFNMLFILLFGNIFMRSYYVSSKKEDLLDYAKILLSQQDITAFRSAAAEAESRNIAINLVHWDGLDPEVLYETTRQVGQLSVEEWYREALRTGILSVLNQNPGKGVIRDTNSHALELYALMGDDTYLFMSTPTANIYESSQLAVNFMLYASAVTLILAMIAAYFMSTRITRPIRQIDVVAQNIADLDFSKRCEVTSKDELGKLAHNINTMAQRLQESIEYLQQRNELLMRDLKREEETNRLRREFIANVSHDFKTPLALITAYAEAVQDTAAQEEENQKAGESIREQCEIITEQAGKMSMLITQLLNLSQLESGMIELDETIFCINEAVFQVLHQCRILMENRGITCDFQYDDEFIVQGDYNRILQVITNLVENAIKYSEDHSQMRITIDTRPSEDPSSPSHVRVRVFNRCPPIENEVLEHLFDSFYKRDKSRGLESKSYGLGLAIVKSIIELHKTAYGVRNVEDGVEFWFELICPDTAENEPSDDE